MTINLQNCIRNCFEATWGPSPGICSFHGKQCVSVLSGVAEARHCAETLPNLDWWPYLCICCGLHLTGNLSNIFSNIQSSFTLLNSFYFLFLHLPSIGRVSIPWVRRSPEGNDVWTDFWSTNGRGQSSIHCNHNLIYTDRSVVDSTKILMPHVDERFFYTTLIYRRALPVGCAIHSELHCGCYLYRNTPIPKT